MIINYVNGQKMVIKFSRFLKKQNKNFKDIFGFMLKKKNNRQINRKHLDSAKSIVFAVFFWCVNTQNHLREMELNKSTYAHCVCVWKNVCTEKNRPCAHCAFFFSYNRH